MAPAQIPITTHPATVVRIGNDTHVQLTATGSFVHDGHLTARGVVGRYTMGVTLDVEEVRTALREHDAREGIRRAEAISDALVEACVTTPHRRPGAHPCKCPSDSADRAHRAALDAAGCRVCALIHGDQATSEVEELQKRFIESLDMIDLAILHSNCPDRDLR